MFTHARPTRLAAIRFRSILVLFVWPAAAISAPAAEPATAEETTAADEIRLGRVSCDVQDGTLAEFLEQISAGDEPAGIVLDAERLRDDCGVTADTKVTLQAQLVRRASALNLVLEPLAAGYYVKDGTIHVTSLAGVAASQVVARKYYVADLASSRWGRAMGNNGGIASLIELVTTTIQPHTWQADDRSIRESLDHRYLEVRHSQDAHDEFRQLLAQLRNTPPTATYGTLLVDQIRTRHSFRFVAAPLAEAVREVAAAYDVNLHLDEAALRSHGISRATPITWQAEDASLRQSLARMLEPLSLTYTIDNEVIKITGDRSGEVVVRTYAVFDLVRPVRRAGGEVAAGDFDTLIDRIKHGAAPGTWGDPGEIKVFPNNLSLVIEHNPLGHEAVAAFLADMRKSALGGERQ